MKLLKLTTALFLGLILKPVISNGQTIGQTIAVGVKMREQTIQGKKAIRAVVDSSVANPNSPTYVKIKGSDFRNGTIEVKVLSRLIDPNSPTARGFIGIAFRIGEDDKHFEGIYIRPTNGRADDQLRRNHATQYFSYPDYPFSRLRTESPGLYESYADMGLDEWIQLKIVVKDAHAKLYINDHTQPCLIVNDLKLGTNSSGSIGLWVDFGTEGFFSDLKITPDK